jgi:hypothetical protein
MPRGSDTIVITSEETLFTKGEDPLDTKLISVEDMEFLQAAINEWYHRTTAS